MSHSRTLRRKLIADQARRPKRIKPGTPDRRVRELDWFPNGMPVPRDLEFSLHATKGYRCVRLTEDAASRA